MTRVLFVAVSSTSLSGFAGLGKESSSFGCKPFVFYPKGLDMPISCEPITPENYMECSWFDDSNLFRPFKRLMNRFSSAFRRLSWEIDFQKKPKQLLLYLVSSVSRESTVMETEALDGNWRFKKLQESFQ